MNFDKYDPLTFPAVPLNVAQTPKIQIKPQGFTGVGQPGQQIGNLFGPITQLRAAVIAGFGELEGSPLKQRTGQHNANPAAHHR
jgi:hypothetical protein